MKKPGWLSLHGWVTAPDQPEVRPQSALVPGACLRCYDLDGLQILHGMDGCWWRTCCETRKTIGHLGTCENSYARSGEWRP